MAKNDPVYLDFKTQKEYEKFGTDNFKYFNKLYGDSKTIEGIEYQPRGQTNECVVVKKAKLLIYKYMESKGRKLFNEIEARIPGDSGAPKIDLYDLDNKIGIEIHWRHKKLNHVEMIPRMLNYQKRFGKCYLVLISWGKGNGFKKCYGFDFLQKHTLDRYTNAGIEVIFFNVDYPKFDWLKL